MNNARIVINCLLASLVLLLLPIANLFIVFEPSFNTG